MTNEEAIELLKNIHWSITTKMNREVPSSLALLMAIEALDKGINISTNSALDHIHNVVRDDAYRRGYEQGKKDAKVEAISVDWIESYLSDCEEWSIAYYVIKQMLYKWRKEREGELHGKIN